MLKPIANKLTKCIIALVINKNNYMGNMKKPYVIAGVIVTLAIVAFVFVGRKTEAPSTNKEVVEESKAVAITDGRYALDTKASVIKWQGEYVGGVAEAGTVSLSSGSATVEGGSITGGNFVIDMATLSTTNNNQTLLDLLKSDEFFGVAGNPTATFELRSFAPSSPVGATLGRYVIGGNLTIRSKQQPISFIATVLPIEGGLSMQGSFAINRADWEIKYNSPTFFQNLGDKAIRDAVSVELDLKAVKQD